MTGLRRPGIASGHQHGNREPRPRKRAASWLSSEKRGVLLGVATFLLLQVFAQYRTLHLWEEMQKTSKNIEQEIHYLSSEVKSSLGGSNHPSASGKSANDTTFQHSFHPAASLLHHSPTNNADEISLVPAWLEEYIVWHNQQRSQLNPQNYPNASILVLRCLNSDSDQCGMARHRLQSVPFALLLAAKSQRILFIKWEQPAPIEEFLLPVSLDWRMPDWLHDAIGDYDRFTIIKGTSDFGIKQAMGPQNIVNLRPNSKDGGRTFYNEDRKGGINNGVGFDRAVRSIWHRIFRPSQAVEKLIQHHLSALNLIPGEYLILHMPEHADESDIPRIALDCAKQVHPSAFAMASASTEDDGALSVVVASPSKSHIDTAVGFTGGNMVALKTSGSILSFDRDTLAWRNKTASQYYQSFAYLYLMTHSRSVIFHHGDLDGKWGTLLSVNPLSGARYRRHHRSLECHRFTEEEMNPPLALVGSQDEESHQNVKHLAIPHQKGVIVSPKFPTWMNDYFTWHKEQLALLSQENWKKHKYLVIRCFEEDEKCGGASDRLQSTPLAVLFASLSKRLLFIKWQRPSNLEEFLLPSPNGLDWRLPDWLHEKFMEAKDYEKSRIVMTSAFKPFIKSYRLVLMRPQKFWPEFFDERKAPNELSYEQLFHYSWEALFQPTPPIDELIQKHLKELNLESGKYVSAHVRAKYAKDKSDDVASIENAVNCASMLRPGWPIYFASDSAKAVQTAVEYGKKMGGMVVARENEAEPLHLDRGKFFMRHWGKQGFHDQEASQYYDVFVDMYLLGKSQCVATGAGGYGRLGSMLSFNRTCSIDHYNTTCQWHGSGSSVRT